MKPKHMAFFVEQAYGHMLPTFGLASELIRRGHRVSYAVTKSFEAAVLRLGAKAVVFEPIQTREKLCTYTKADGSTNDFDDNDPAVRNFFDALQRERTQTSLQQLERLYQYDRPDLVVHDDCLDVAGRMLADKWELPKVRHCPILLDKCDLPSFSEDKIILVSVPEFFHKDLEMFDSRFHFIGFCADGRHGVFEPWVYKDTGRPLVLASATTGLLPQIDFCKLIGHALGDEQIRVVLSIAGKFDPVSEINPELLTELPKNMELARSSSNLDILQHASVFIGQGGQGSTLEAIYCGIPPVLIPPTQFHDTVALRIAELGIGIRIPAHEVSADAIRDGVKVALGDQGIRNKVKEYRMRMRTERGTEVGAGVIEQAVGFTA